MREYRRADRSCQYFQISTLIKLDKEIESRGPRFARYADDVNIFVKSGKAADSVMKSVICWLERKLFLKVSATKTKVVRPMKSEFLSFGFWKIL